MIIDSKETKTRILSKFLEISPLEGWNDQALLIAIRECHIDEKYAELIFENGCLTLAEFYISEQNLAAIENVEKIKDFHNKKIRDKITIFLNERFNVEKDNQIALQRLINFYLNPQNFISTSLGIRPMTQALKACYQIADSMWLAIKDQSTDFNFYTKRLTLAKIILRSLMVFVKDESEGFVQTRDFIDSQIAKVMKFEKRKMQMKNIVNEVFLNNDNGSKSFKPKSPREFIKDLPFVRLMKFKK